MPTFLSACSRALRDSRRPVDAITSTALLLAVLASPATIAQGVIPLPAIRQSYCASGPTIYKNVAKMLDSGLKKEIDYWQWSPGPSGPDQYRTNVEAEHHNKLVREIYAHPQLKPDEVAERWLSQCKAHFDRRTRGGAPWILVDTLK